MKVLTTDSTVGCGHPDGKAKTDGAQILTVKGKGVLTASGVSGKTVEGCPLVESANVVRCKTVVTVSGGGASKLTIEGEPVLLDGLAGTTDGTTGGVAGSLTATANQDRLTAG